MKKIFISQNVLDKLFEENKANLDGDLLTVHSKGTQQYKLVPAYKFLGTEDGSEDKGGMVGKIFSKEELDRAGADAYMDSVLVNDVPYKAESGFVGLPPETEQPREEEKTAAEGEAADDQMLSDYLLKIL